VDIVEGWLPAGVLAASVRNGRHLRITVQAGLTAATVERVVAELREGDADVRPGPAEAGRRE